jgi:hypothetical protein
VIQPLRLNIRYKIKEKLLIIPSKSMFALEVLCRRKFNLSKKQNIELQDPQGSILSTETLASLRTDTTLHLHLA